MCVFPLRCACADDVDARIAFIQNELDYASKYSRLWQNGWMTATGLATASSFYEYEANDTPDKRYDGLVYSVLGVISLQKTIRSPLRSHQYAKQLRVMPQNNLDESLWKLAEAEKMMALAASREIEERSVQSRFKAVSLNLVASLLIAYDDDRPKQALTNFALYALATEVKTYTTPVTMTFAKQRYDAGNYLTPPSRRKLTFKERLSLSMPKGRQIQLEMKF